MNDNSITKTMVSSSEQQPSLIQQNPDEIFLYQSNHNPLFDSLQIQNDLAFSASPSQMQDYMAINFNSQNGTQAEQMMSPPLQLVSPEANYMPYGANQLSTDPSASVQSSMCYFAPTPSVPVHSNTTGGIPSPKYDSIDSITSSVDNIVNEVHSELPTPTTSSTSSVSHLQLFPAFKNSEPLIKMEEDAQKPQNSANNNPPPPTPPSTTNSTNGKKKRAARRRLTVVQKIAHNKIEKRYRTNINEKIFGLQALIDPSWNSQNNKVPILPTLATTEGIEENEESSEESSEESQQKDKKGKRKSVSFESAPSSSSSLPVKPNKSSILEQAAEYIIYLKEINSQLRGQNKDLQKKLNDNE